MRMRPREGGVVVVVATDQRTARQRPQVGLLCDVARSLARDAHLRRRSRALIRRLDLPLPFDVAVLCERLGALRGTPITLLEWDLAVPGPSGMLVSRDDEDVIVFQAGTSRSHQAHIILHEVGHLVAQDIASGRPTRPRVHTSYSDREERDAEIVASTIMHRAILMTRRIETVDQIGERSVHGSLGLWSGWT